MDASAKRLLLETWTNPVFGDTFPEEQTAERLLWAEQWLGSIAAPVTSELRTAVSEGLPEWDEAKLTKVVVGEVRDKTIGFSAALTAGEINDPPVLTDLSVAVGLMYTVDQTIDRGDKQMVRAVELFGDRSAPPGRSGIAAVDNTSVQARSTMLSRICEKIRGFALPDDVPFIEACFIDQVLKNEANMYRWSRTFESGNVSERAVFLAGHARALADTTTTNAGFPSISSSLHAIYRRYNTSLPALSQVYESQDMTDLLQVCNVIVRIWDELGDWKMDMGSDPEKGIFVLNPFNQYHDATVERYCELAFIADPEQIGAIKHAFAHFHRSEAALQQSTNFILEVFGTHIRQYLTKLRTEKQEAWDTFKQYITLCKRVMEIGYVNRIGDIALASPRVDPRTHGV